AHTSDGFPVVRLLRRDTSLLVPLTNHVEIVLEGFPIISLLLLCSFCRPLSTSPGAGLFRLPPVLLVVPPRLHEQCPLGIVHRKLRHGKSLQLYSVDRRLVLVESLIATNVIGPARDMDQRWQQVGTIRSLPTRETRIAQLAQGETCGNARPQIG